MHTMNVGNIVRVCVAFGDGANDVDVNDAYKSH